MQKGLNKQQRKALGLELELKSVTFAPAFSVLNSIFFLLK